MVSSDHLIPGERGAIRATVSTKGKRGRISKNVFVFSNDPERTTVTLTLVMNVRDPFHTKRFEAREIFRKPCADCHVDRGKGKTGASLFNAVCLICHRMEKRDTHFTKFKNMPDEALRTAIFSGVPGTLMPGFSWKEGGFLEDSEIESIIRYVKGR